MSSTKEPAHTDLAALLGDALVKGPDGAPDPATIQVLRAQGFSDADIRTVLGLKPDYPL